jgi:hypothetical protein
MSDTAFVLGFLLATLVPALLAGWLVRRWIKGRAGTLLAVVLALGAVWLGMGAFVSVALSGLSVPMD